MGELIITSSYREILLGESFRIVPTCTIVADFGSFLNIVSCGIYRGLKMKHVDLKFKKELEVEKNMVLHW